MAKPIRQPTKFSFVCVRNQNKVKAEVMDFRENKYLNVVINKSVKLPMIWNGRMYEGRAAGMDFESKGPKVIRSQTALRG